MHKHGLAIHDGVKTSSHLADLERRTVHKTKYCNKASDAQRNTAPNTHPHEGLLFEVQRTNVKPTLGNQYTRQQRRRRSRQQTRHSIIVVEMCVDKRLQDARLARSPRAPKKTTKVDKRLQYARLARNPRRPPSLPSIIDVEMCVDKRLQDARLARNPRSPPPPSHR